jgi:hypothetical protein
MIFPKTSFLHFKMTLLSNYFINHCTPVHLVSSTKTVVAHSILLVYYLTILERAWSANFKMVWYVLLHAATSETGARRPRSISNIGLLCQTRKTPTLKIAGSKCNFSPKISPIPASVAGGVCTASVHSADLQ